jgi:hypothetical protein
MIILVKRVSAIMSIILWMRKGRYLIWFKRNEDLTDYIFDHLDEENFLNENFE